MARRPSLPERGISSEDAGLTNVTENRAKSGSLSSEEGDGFMPKQSKFFKNLSRSLDPAAAPPKKKDYLEEYQKYKAKRAYNLHGVVKQQTIDLGSLGVSGSSSSADAQNRRFSTGMNPPQLAAGKDARSSTLPSAPRSNKGPPPPVAPRKKSINLPVINEPAPIQKVPSPMQDTPSYILSAVKKEQQRAEMEAKKAAAKPQLSEREKVSEPLAENLKSDEGQGTPTEHKVEVTPVSEVSSVGNHVIESSLNQEPLSHQNEQGVSNGDVKCGEKSHEASEKGTGEVEVNDEVVKTEVIKDGVPVEDFIQASKGIGEEGKKGGGEGGANVTQVEEGQAGEVVQGSKSSEDATANEVGETGEFKSQGSDDVVLNKEIDVSEKEETKVSGEDQLQGGDETGKEESYEENDGGINNKESKEESKEEGKEDSKGEGKDESKEEKKEESEEGSKEENRETLTNGSQNAVEPVNHEESNTVDAKIQENDKSYPLGIPTVKVSEPEEVGDSTEDANEVTTVATNVAENAISNGEVTNGNGTAVEVSNEGESSADMVVQKDAQSSSGEVEEGTKPTESAQTNGDKKATEESKPMNIDKEATEKLSKTADLLLSFSQEKNGTVSAESSDLSGIGEELNKLNMTIGELAHDKSNEKEVSKEDKEKLEDIKAMQDEMRSMQMELDTYL